MSNSDKRLIYSFMRNLSKNQLHELKEFFHVSIWNNKSNAERRALGRKFALKSSLIGHTYHFISEREIS